MTGTYNLLLVFASYCVAVLASYTAIYFGTRVMDMSGASRKFWLAAGAFCMGSGIWSMHFVGMSAFNMPMDMEMSFNTFFTLLSWLPAILASALALYVITLPKVGLRSVAASSLIMGAGIFAMHYGGMYAMQMTPAVQYDIPLVIASGIIAVVASGAALIICRKVREVPEGFAMPAKVVASLIMGVAICGMHYTGMAAAIYPMGAEMAENTGLRGEWMGIPTAVAACSLLLLAVYAAYTDFAAMERARREKRQLEEAAEQMAFFDASTNLGNRAFLENTVLKKITRTTREGKNARFRLFYFELTEHRDMIQRVGEEVAEAIAIEFAQRLKKGFPDVSVLARYSKHGFIALVEEPKLSNDEVLQTAAGLMKAPVEFAAKRYTCQWGLGFSEYPTSGTNSRNLIRSAQRIQSRFGLEQKAA